MSLFAEDPFSSVHQSFDIRLHFYFCILAAVGLSRKQGRIATNRQKNAFLMKWLKNARKTFPSNHAAESEIEWLRAEIMRHSPDRDPEPMLFLIYQTASDMKSA